MQGGLCQDKEAARREAAKAKRDAAGLKILESCEDLLSKLQASVL